MTEVRLGLNGSGRRGSLGFGLYLANAVAREMDQSEEKRARLVQCLGHAGVDVWTANAFPYGGFHGRRVKEAAFLPDWRATERLAYTCHTADVLGHLMMPGDHGSISTCPIGYGPDALEFPEVVAQLRQVQDHLRMLERQKEVRLVLAIEPEPDGAFERVADLAAWLDSKVLYDVSPPLRRIGICWDLCHSAVVGEEPHEVLQAVKAHSVPIGKVQVSSALRFDGPMTPEAESVLRLLARDPYFHQVRGEWEDGSALAFRDLPEFLAREDLSHLGQIRIHCHVPLHRTEYESGLRGTEWRRPLHAAFLAGERDFEVETYTLPVLPSSFRESTTVNTIVAEMEACMAQVDTEAAGGSDAA